VPLAALEERYALRTLLRQVFELQRTFHSLTAWGLQVDM